MFGGCEAEVLYCNGDVDVAMVLPVGTYPFFIVHDGCNDDGGCCGEPLTVVALAEFLSVGFVCYDVEPPGLTVDC